MTSVETIGPARIAERDNMWRTENCPVRRRLVRDIVEGRVVDAPTVERGLGIDPSRHVRALILWQDREIETVVGHDLAELVQSASSLPGVLGCARTVVVSGDHDELWVWATWTCTPPSSLADDIEAMAPRAAELRVSVGPRCSGVSGMRRSHQGAREAARVAGASLFTRGRRVVEYDEVAVVAMLTHDTEQARWFVHDTLGCLARSGRTHDELRETLRVYLAYGRSRLAAAEILYVARNTVAYRVAKAVRLLGRPLDADPVKLRLALEIARALPGVLGGDESSTALGR